MSSAMISTSWQRAALWLAVYFGIAISSAAALFVVYEIGASIGLLLRFGFSGPILMETLVAFSVVFSAVTYPIIVIVVLSRAGVRIPIVMNVIWILRRLWARKEGRLRRAQQKTETS